MTPEEIANERRRSGAGPRALKPAGSVEWCWQTISLLENRFQVSKSFGKELRQVWDEIQQQRAWEKIPSKEPYGSPEKMIRELLGIELTEFEREVTRREAIQEAAKATNGEMLGRWPLTGNLPVRNHQEKRALNHGVGVRTQRKLDRLARERPDLLDQVRQGALTTHRAAVVAGFVREPSLVERIVRLLQRLTLRELKSIERELRVIIEKKSE